MGEEHKICQYCGKSLTHCNAFGTLRKHDWTIRLNHWIDKKLGRNKEEE
jgi:hypothetical protein